MLDLSGGQLNNPLSLNITSRIDMCVFPIDLKNLKSIILSDQSLVRARDAVMSSLPSLTSIVGLPSVSGIANNPSNFGRMVIMGMMNEK